MKKNVLFIVTLAIALTAFTQDDSLFFQKTKKVRYNLPKANAIVTVNKSVEPFDFFYTPTIDNHYVGFKEAIAFKESRGNYKKVNSFGYLGKYQFGESTLHRIRIYDTDDFLNDPKLQEDAFLNYAKLSYEVGNSYMSPSEVIINYLNKYPNTSVKAEMETLLIDSFITSKNYEKAMELLETNKNFSDS